MGYGRPGWDPGAVALQGMLLEPSGAPDRDANSIFTSLTANGSGWVTFEIASGVARNTPSVSAGWGFTTGLKDALGGAISTYAPGDYLGFLSIEVEAIPSSGAFLWAMFADDQPAQVGQHYIGCGLRSNGTGVNGQTLVSGSNIDAASTTQSTARRLVWNWGENLTTALRTYTSRLVDSDGAFLAAAYGEDARTGFGSLDQIWVGVGCNAAFTGTVKARFRALLIPSEAYTRALGL